MPLFGSASDLWCRFQGELFPELTDAVGRLSDRHRKLVAVLEFAPPEDHFSCQPGFVGRPCADRVARAFIARAIWNLATTRDLIDRIDADPVLRRLCGWPRRSAIPSEATFSRAFAECASSDLPARMHEALVTTALETPIVGHVSRDSTAIEAREKPAPKPAKAEGPKRKRGRPRKGEVVVKEDKRLDAQLRMDLAEMIADLPKQCDRGTKRNGRGHTVSWNGSKLHVDPADGGIPISCLLTSASLHDSQAAIPLATETGQRVTDPYELMGAACDAKQIHEFSKSMGHVAIIDPNPRRDAALKEAVRQDAKAQRALNDRDATAVRYTEHTNSERVNARLKDDDGGRHVRVRGAAKVSCHLMFGILALTVEHLQRLLP